MSKKMPKISYDKESEVMLIEMKKGKSADSDIHGNIVIDYDKKGDAMRVNFYGFHFDAFRIGLKAIKEFSKHSEVALSVK